MQVVLGLVVASKLATKVRGTGRTYKSTECLKVKCKLCAVKVNIRDWLVVASRVEILMTKLATKVTSGTSILRNW